MTIHIHNPGHLDLAAITTFGISAKPGSSPIGFFGTGLKYAIAVTLRLGGRLMIINNHEFISFEVAKAAFRDKEFDFIDMTVESPSGTTTTRLPFTTELGKTWEPWQALREFICNAMDEGGAVVPCVQQGGVNFVLDCPEYEPLAANHYRDIFLDTSVRDPILDTPNLEVYPMQSSRLYYRGVRVYDLEVPAYMTYNIKGTLELTEDRTVKSIYSAKQKLAMELSEKGNTATTKILCRAKDGTFEAILDYSQYWLYTTEFLDTVRSERASGTVIPRGMWSALLTLLVKETKEHEANLSPMEQRMLEKALSFLSRAGHPITAPLHCVETLGHQVMGQVLDSEIFIAHLAFQMGMRQLIGTLFEEQMHITHGVLDCTRDMQNKLFDMLIGEIANRLEEVL